MAVRKEHFIRLELGLSDTVRPTYSMPLLSPKIQLQLINVLVLPNSEVKFFPYQSSPREIGNILKVYYFGVDGQKRDRIVCKPGSS